MKKPMYRQEILFETDEGIKYSFQIEYNENKKEVFKSGFESELKRNGWKLGKIIKDSGIYLHKDWSSQRLSAAALVAITEHLRAKQ